MTKQKLFDEDSDEENVALKTENEYAKKYDRWREKEELHKLEQKYGSKPLGSDASETDSEDESDDRPEINEEVEVQFLKTLSLLKTKDPRIYDPNYEFFNEKKSDEKEKDQDVKKVTFADSDDDDDDDDPNIFSIEKKAEIEDVKQTSKPADGKVKNFLTGKAEHINDDVEKDLAPLKSLWSDPKLSDGEAFLRDYILNKRYLDKDAGTTAEEKVRDDEDLEADEKTVEEQGKFERAYNFRFEEPDEEYLKRYPRTMNYIRPKDDRRSRKRAEVKDRKEQEKKKKMEEIARLKALKLKEIQEKIAKIKEVTGNEDLAFEEDDIEGDFDPAEHDRRMKALFDEQYYGQADNEKPVFPDLDKELEIENWDHYEPEAHDNDENEGGDGNGPHCEDEDFNMDADYDPKKAKENLLEELKRNMGKKRRNRKNKSKLAELLSEEKPKFVPHVEQSYSEFMEEYYKMDCEDVIGGDLPTRFKYREVVPNDYGLSIEEILLADDRELTQWVPLKKMVKYRPHNIEKSEINTYKQKGADERLKKKILPSLFKDLPEAPEVVVPLEETIKKKKKKKKNKEAKNNEINDNSEVNTDHLNNSHSIIDTGNTDDVNTKEKRKSGDDEQHSEEQNIENYESSKSKVASAVEYKKIRRDKKKHKQDGDEKTPVNDVSKNDNKNEPAVQKPTKKDKKNKHKQFQSSTGNIKLNKVNRGANESNIHSTMNGNKNKKKKNKQNPFIVEDVDATINKASTDTSTLVINTNKKQGLKRKASSKNDGNIPNKKKFKNNAGKIASKKSTEKLDPLAKLSDARLKAYGLNPKKYRSFLKYKKF